MKRTAHSRVLILLVSHLGGFSLANPSAAQESPGVTLQALPLEVDLDLDGRILEESWFSAVPITDFTQQEPVEGQWNPTPWVSAMSQVQFDDVSKLAGSLRGYAGS